MGAVYAAIEDLSVFRSFTAAEQEQAEALLTSASALLRRECKEWGYDLDSLIEDDEDLAETAKVITIQAVLRALTTISNSSAPVTQESQTALGYSVQHTYYNPGQALYIMNNELDKLGILRQRYGALEVYGI